LLFFLKSFIRKVPFLLRFCLLVVCCNGVGLPIGGKLCWFVLHIDCRGKESFVVEWCGDFPRVRVSLPSLSSKVIGVPYSRGSGWWVKFIYAFWLWLLLLEKDRSKFVFCWEYGLFGLGLNIYLISLYHFHFWNCSFSSENASSYICCWNKFIRLVYLIITTEYFIECTELDCWLCRHFGVRLSFLVLCIHFKLHSCK